MLTKIEEAMELCRAALLMLPKHEFFERSNVFRGFDSRYDEEKDEYYSIPSNVIPVLVWQ